MDLPGFDEPVGLGARAAADPAAVRAEIASGRLLVGSLWKAWGPTLAAEGVDRATLSAILRGYGYELWLWAAGERTWAQCLEGLAARVERRVGALGDGRAPGRAAKAGGRSRAAATRKPPIRATKAGRTPKVAKTRKVTKAQKTKATRVAKGANTTKTRAPTKARRATATKATKTAKGRATGSTRKRTMSTTTTKAGGATKAGKTAKSETAKTAAAKRATPPARRTRRR